MRLVPVVVAHQGEQERLGLDGREHRAIEPPLHIWAAVMGPGQRERELGLPAGEIAARAHRSWQEHDDGLTRTLSALQRELEQVNQLLDAPAAA